MAIAFISNVGSVTWSMSLTANNITVPAGGYPVGTLIVARYAETPYGGGGGGITDSRGNTYGSPSVGFSSNIAGSSMQNFQACSVLTTALQAGDTITMGARSVTKTTGGFTCDAFSGALYTTQGGSNCPHGEVLAGTSVSSGAYTPTATGVLLVGVCACSTTQTNDSDTTNGSWVSLTKVGSGPFANAQYKLCTGTTSLAYDNTFASGDAALNMMEYPVFVPVTMPVQPIIPTCAVESSAVW